MRAQLRRGRPVAALVAALLLAAGCGGGGDDNDETTATTEAAAGGAVSSVDDVSTAVIRIEAQGSFVDPEIGAYESAGSGSGFIIDESGIAVANNHVVVGAGLLRVYVGDDDEARNAKVVGVSECSDLAVIDIEGDGFPYLAWHEGDVRPGLEVFAAGFPLGDPEFTLTKGIVSKAKANGDSSWASVDHVIEHDANIQPGNSGGALVTEQGAVVGVNYAGGSPTNTDQFFAIAVDEATPIIDTLRSGEDFESVGVNGQVVVDEESQLAGVWVAGVASGSPADEAGIEGGDIITEIEGVSVGADGTMADYCDVLRSRDATDAMEVEVLRYSTEEVLRGQLNGDPLEQVFSFAQEYQDDVEDAGGEAPAETEYTSVSDDSGTLTVDVPTAWSDVQTGARDIAGVTAPAIVAAPNVQEFIDTWGTPGMAFAATPEFGTDLEGLIDQLEPSDCTPSGREDYDDGAYQGRVAAYNECGGSAANYFVIAAMPPDQSSTIVVVVQALTDADLEVLDQVIQTFRIS